MKQREMTPQQLEAITGYKANTIQRACREGQIKGHKVGNRWLVDVESALQFGKQKPHAEHTRKRQEKLEEAHNGGLDLPEPEEHQLSLEDIAPRDIFAAVTEAPELEFDEDMDPVTKALVETAWTLIGQAVELLVKVGYNLRKREENNDRTKVS